MVHISLTRNILKDAKRIRANELSFNINWPEISNMNLWRHDVSVECSADDLNSLTGNLTHFIFN